MLRLPIASPCDEPWEEMQGDERARHCDACERRVFDLSARTEVEARAVVAVFGSSGFCVRYRVDARGDVVHRPRIATAVVAVALLAGACGGTAPPAAAPIAPLPDAASTRRALPAPVAPAEEATTTDTDGDGVPDNLDACPRSPGAASADPKRNGCPFVGIVSQGDIRILEQVAFQFGSARADLASLPMLDAIAQVLKENPQIARMAVVGHASLDEPNAKKLGESRAKAVAASLVARGVDPQRLLVESSGSERPIASNTTKEGREKNRRVDFDIRQSASCAPPPVNGSTTTSL